MQTVTIASQSKSGSQPYRARSPTTRPIPTAAPIGSDSVARYQPGAHSLCASVTSLRPLSSPGLEQVAHERVELLGGQLLPVVLRHGIPWETRYHEGVRVLDGLPDVVLRTPPLAVS